MYNPTSTHKNQFKVIRNCVVKICGLKFKKPYLTKQQPFFFFKKRRSNNLNDNSFSYSSTYDYHFSHRQICGKKTKKQNTERVKQTLIKLQR